MKKILVTGSNGFLGQKISERFLAKRDFTLVATSKGVNRFPVKDGYDYFDFGFDPHSLEQGFTIMNKQLEQNFFKS